MNITKIKDTLEKNTNKRLKFKFNGNRNQTEEFKGIITNTYKSLFIVKPEDNDVARSFTYTDILIGNLEINRRNVDEDNISKCTQN